jgi:hypothetical protein
MKRLLLFAAVLLASAPAAAQWPERRDPTLPRTPDGKVNMTARAPRTSGRPVLNGVWLSRPDPLGTPGGVENDILPRYFVNSAEDHKGPPTDGVTPAFVPLFADRLKGQGVDDPIAHCKPAGIPRLVSFPNPVKIIETPSVVLMLYENDMTFRQVFTDGRPLPPDPDPAYMGYSVGAWEGQAFVVTSSGFRDRGWLDAMGRPHSDALRVTERYRRIDTGHMQVDVTITDSKSLTAPLTFTQHLLLQPDQDVIEYFCNDNEKDREHYVRPKP